MAAPVVAGALALMLQRDPALTTARARDILAARARHDAHTGRAPWTPGYGYGKLDVAWCWPRSPDAAAGTVRSRGVLQPGRHERRLRG